MRVPPPVPRAEELGELNDVLDHSGEHEAFHREDSEPSVDLQEAAGSAAEHLPGRRWTCPRCRTVYEDTGRAGDARERCPQDDFPLVEDMTDVVLASRYLLRRLIGVGGMGSTVWRGWQLSTRRPVAVKLLPATNEKAAARFAREAQIVSNLNHPHITTVHDYGKSEDGKLFLVMELLRGQTLRRALKKDGPLTVQRALRVADQILGALDHAHRRGIVHRDLKTGNLFLTANGDEPDFVKVLDFGIAEFIAGDGAARGDDSVTNPATGELGGAPRPDLDLRGTPYYMAPEQLTSTRVDARTDLYALGIVLYCLLTGRVPFRSATHSELFHDILTRPAPTFAEVAPEADIPEPVEVFVRRALEKRPEDRFDNARSMRAALRMLWQTLGLQQEESHDGLAAPAAHAVATAAAHGQAAGARDDDVVAPDRRRWLGLAAALVVLLGAGAWLLVSLLGSGASEEPPGAPRAVAERAAAPPLAARGETADRATVPASAIAGPGEGAGDDGAAPPSDLAAVTAGAAPTAELPAAAPDALAGAAGPDASAAGADAAPTGTEGLAVEAEGALLPVRVESRPAGAAVSAVPADGGEARPLGSTPFDLRLPRGRFTLVFEREGYRTERMELDLSDEDAAEAEAEPVLVEAELVAERRRPPRARRELTAPRAAEAAPQPAPPPVVAAPAPEPPAKPAPQKVRVEVLDEESARDFVVPAERPPVRPRERPAPPKVEVLD